MRNRLLGLLALLMTGVLVPLDSNAQRFRASYRYTSLGLMVNATEYFGDIVPKSNMFSFDMKFTKPQLGILLTRRINPKLSFRGSLAFGRLKGSDNESTSKLVAAMNPDDLSSLSTADINVIGRYKRNLHFRNDIIELAGTFTYDLKGNIGPFHKRPKGIVPYLIGGVAGFYHNPKAKPVSGNGWTALQPLRTEGKNYSKYQISFPVGLGLRYRVSNRMDLAFELGYRFTMTDYLDDVSGNYLDMGTLGSEEAKSFHDRSREVYDQMTGKERDTRFLPGQPTLLDAQNGLYPGTDTYEGADGQSSTVYGGYGHGGEFAGQRGNPKDSDTYLMAGFQLHYVIAPGIRCPKFRK